MAEQRIGGIDSPDGSWAILVSVADDLVGLTAKNEEGEVAIGMLLSAEEAHELRALVGQAADRVIAQRSP